MAYPGCPYSDLPNGSVMLTSNQDFSIRMVEVKQVQAALNLIGTENFIVKVQVPFFTSKNDIFEFFLEFLTVFVSDTKFQSAVKTFR